MAELLPVALERTPDGESRAALTASEVATWIDLAETGRPRLDRIRRS